MHSSLTSAALATGLLLIALAGCSSATPDASAPPESSAPPAASSTEAVPSASTDESSPSPSADAPTASLMVADSALGEIVVDGAGMTVYMFDNDTQGSGASSCAGQCAANWPAVTTDAGVPEVEGVTGEVGTITGVDGATQVTLNGWPLYSFIGDAAVGDVAGQGVNEVWWVLTPAGERMAE